jgi:hypothetical protein
VTSRCITQGIVLTLLLVLTSAHLRAEEDTPKKSERPVSRIQSIRIAQLDFGRKGTDFFIPYSDWGRLTAVYMGVRGLMYLNLSINEKWVIQNLPVLSERGQGRLQSVSVSFGLGVKRGYRVNRATYGITLSEAIRKTPAPDRGIMPIQHEIDNERCETGDLQGGIPPAGPVVGGTGGGDEKHTIPDPVNQEAPKEGCIPTALSNSLKTLKKNHNLNMKDDDISIDSLGGAVDYKVGSGTPAGWIKKKKDYVSNKGLPIDTTEGTIDDLPKLIDRKCDVEIRGGTPEWGHVVMVVGVVKGADGKYTIDIAHDTKQGEADGRVTESIVYDPATKTFKGGTWLDGKKLQEIVVECPKK